VRDVASGILAAAERGRSGQCYILANRYISTGELFARLRSIGGRSVRRVLPMGFAKATAPLAELYYRLLRQPPLYTRYSLHALESNSRFSHDKATRELGYSPRPFEETLAATVAWLRAQGRLQEEPAQ
jgi:dihydroflavonol-4-reductase